VYVLSKPLRSFLDPVLYPPVHSLIALLTFLVNRVLIPQSFPQLLNERSRCPSRFDLISILNRRHQHSGNRSGFLIIVQRRFCRLLVDLNLQIKAKRFIARHLISMSAICNGAAYRVVHTPCMSRRKLSSSMIVPDFGPILARMSYWLFSSVSKNLFWAVFFPEGIV
jgi:hypothetical protein